MTLPFQKLPCLVMKSIFETMAFLDLFMLSCTSAKTKRIVKTVFKIRNHWLLVVVGELLSLQIVSGTDENYKEEIAFTSKNSIEWIPNLVVHEFHVNIGAVENVLSNYIEDEDDTFNLLTYWCDPKIGFYVIFDALFEVFGAKVEKVGMAVDKIPVKNYQKEIDWIDNWFPTLPAFTFHGNCSFQTYVWLLKNAKAKNLVTVCMEPSEYPENHEIVNLEMEEIRIKHGSWMALQDIKAIKARNIRIEDISLADDQINLLLKNLKASKETSNLKKMILKFYRVADLEIVLEGLDVINEDEMKPEDSLNQWSFELANREKCTVIYAEYDNSESDDLMFGFEIQIED